MGLTKSEGCTFILMVVFVYAGGVLSSAFLPNKLGLLRCYREKRRWQTIRRNCDIFASHSKSISIWHQHKNMTHSKSNGFWHQPKNTIESSLHSPPPDHILELIREQTYRGGFEPARDFRQCAKIVHGSIPLDLVGTLAINCPGRIRVGARMLGHWFDGDGYLVTLSLDGNNNEASVHGRYVRTSRFKAQEDKNIEKAEDKNVEPPLAFSGAWTKAGMGKWWENFIRIPENPANTATMWLPPLQLSSDKLRSPRLFALCEGGHPIEIDPISLEVLNDEQPFRSSPKSPKQKKAASYFSAHFSQDPNTNNIYNHGYILDPSPFSTPRINLMKLSPEGILLHQKQSKMPYNTFVHDATISQNFYLYFVMPYTVPSGIELIPFILGKEPLGGGMRWRGAPSTGNEGHGDGLKSYLHVHSKNNLWLNWKIEMPDPVSVYHIVDAFEEKRDQELRLKVRLAELFSDPPADRTNLEKQFANQYAVPSGERLHAKLREYTFLLCANGSGKLLESKDISSGRSSSEYRVGSLACEYPITNQVGTENRLRYAWINTLSPPKINLDGDEKLSDWFDGVQKVDLNCGELSSQIISFGEGTYCGPPYFVPKRRLLGYSSTEHEEDDGYIVTLLYKSERHSSDVAILNSKTMDILCIMELDFHIPYSFHGEFLPDFVIPKTTLRGAN